MSDLSSAGCEENVNGPLLTVHLAKVALVVPRPPISILIGSVIVEITSIYVYTVIGLFLIHLHAPFKHTPARRSGRGDNRLPILCLIALDSRTRRVRVEGDDGSSMIGWQRWSKWLSWQA